MRILAGMVGTLLNFVSPKENTAQTARFVVCLEATMTRVGINFGVAGPEIVEGGRSTGASACGGNYNSGGCWTTRQVGTVKCQCTRVGLSLRIRNDLAWRVLRTGFRRASRFGAEKIMAILGWANSPDVSKGLRKVLLGLEAAGHSHV